MMEVSNNLAWTARGKIAREEKLRYLPLLGNLFIKLQKHFFTLLAEFNNVINTELRPDLGKILSCRSSQVLLLSEWIEDFVN